MHKITAWNTDQFPIVHWPVEVRGWLPSHPVHVCGRVDVVSANQEAAQGKGALIGQSYQSYHSPLIVWYLYPLKAGHADTTSRVLYVLPNFIMLLGALSNIYLGSCKSKDGDNAEPIKKIFKLNTYNFFLEVG